LIDLPKAEVELQKRIKYLEKERKKDALMYSNALDKLVKRKEQIADLNREIEKAGKQLGEMQFEKEKLEGRLARKIKNLKQSHKMHEFYKKRLAETKKHDFSAWKRIIQLQNQFYPNWRTELPRTLYSTALAGEVGEVCGTVTHLDGGGTNNRKYSPKKVLHQAVDSYVQIVLLLERSGFTEKDFKKELDFVVSKELPSRLNVKLGLVGEEEATP